MDWEDACDIVLGRKFCVWKELLQLLLFARAKVFQGCLQYLLMSVVHSLFIENTPNNRMCFAYSLLTATSIAYY